MKITKRCLPILLIFVFALSLSAQENGKKVLNIEDYGRWRSVGSAAISGDGNWITFVYSLREKDDTLYVKNLVSDKIYQVPRGSGPKFSEDSRWVAYTLNKPQKEIKKLKKDKKPVPKKAELLNLASGEKYAVDNMSSFTFSKASNYLAVKKTKSDPKAKHKGSDLLLRNLKTGMNELVGGVSEFSFNKPYISDWKPRLGDYYRINISTGEKTEMFKAQNRTLGLSPDSKHFLYWKDGQVWAYYISSGKSKNLTQNLSASFVNQEYDRYGEKPPYGVAGWTKDKKSVILNAKYDLWSVPLSGGKAKNLTGGEGDKNEIRFRYVRLDPEEKFINMSQPIMLSAFGQWTKKAGFYELNKAIVSKLIYEDKSFDRRPRKAKNADKLLYTIQSFVDFPNYYVSDTKFSVPKKVTDANPWQSEYKWGRRILFDFTNSKGVRLQGTLAIPEDFYEGKKLPMHVNYYEKNSQNLHRYPAPRWAGSPNFAGLISNGYLVMQPDIHFNFRTTHSDMLECIEAAVKKVIEMGYADPAKISLHGHSFSGQGSAFAATHSNMFAAIVYGAGATDLISDFNQLWKTAGTNQHRYDTYGQGRFITNPYDDLELYIQQSAVFHARDMNTPLLVLHGTDDGSVEWLQAIEFYNALRFNGKNVILLSYPGAGHGLRKLENQKDFQVRTMEFLNHYIKGKPAPDWMLKGVPFLKKKK